MSRILLIEPDAPLRKTMIQYLAGHGHSLFTAATAQDAVSSADSQKPDLVIVELAMPQHNGIAFLQEFRSYTDWLRIPIIVYSQIPRDDTGLSAAAWQKWGVGAYLYKPTTSLANLNHHIEELLPNYETV